MDILEKAKKLRKEHKYVPGSPIGCYSFMWDVFDGLIEEVERLRDALLPHPNIGGDSRLNHLWR